MYKHSASSSTDIAGALALLSTRTQATGKDLEDLTLKTIKLAKTQREDVATVVPLVTQAFLAWGISVEQQASKMDYLRVVSQKTAVPVSSLTQELVSQMPQLQRLGYNFDQAATLIGNFAEAGVVAQGGLNAFRKVVGSFGKDGKDAAVEWAKLVKGIEDGSVSYGEFIKIAGNKGGNALFKAIEDGRADIEKTVDATKKLASEGGQNLETYKTKFTKLQHELETVVAGHYQLISAVGLATPLITLLGGKFVDFGKLAIPAITGIVETVGGLTSALGLVGIAIATATLGFKAWQNLSSKFSPDGSDPNSLFNQREYAFTGFGAAPIYKPRVNQNDYVNSLVAPKDSPADQQGRTQAGPPPPARTFDARELKQAFTELGIKDLQGQLDEALKAFQLLKSAGKLSEAWQVEQATKHITELRAQIAELAAGYKELPKSSAELLSNIGDLAQKIGTEPAKAADHLHEMGAALSELLAKVQSFTGPKIGPDAEATVEGLTRAMQLYAHAAAVANSESSKKIDTVPMLEFAKVVDEVDLSFSKANSSTSLYIKTTADLNQELHDHNEVLKGLPALHHELADAILDPLANIKGITEAFHYFNIQTPAELQQHASESQRQYEIIKRAAGDAAVATQIAWTKATLAQIDLDHSLEITDQDLYEQRKRMAEDSLKHLEGEYKGAAGQHAKYVRSLGEELSQFTKQAFDNIARTLARNLVNWKDWGSSIKDLAKGLAEDLLSVFIKGLFAPLEKRIADLAGSLGAKLPGWMGGGGGSGAAQQAAGAASGGAGAAGSAGSAAGGATGILGTIGAISAAVGAVSSVIGNFQSAAQNKSLDVLVNHTLRIFNVVSQMLDEMYLAKGQLFAKLDDIWKCSLNIYDLLGKGISVGGVVSGSGTTSRAYTFNNCVFNGTSPDAIKQAFIQAEIAGAF